MGFVLVKSLLMANFAILRATYDDTRAENKKLQVVP